jgi:hypothetical protein
MKFLKSLLMGTGGVVLAGLVLALLAPKALRAIAATAVQVVNTTAAPAITQDTSKMALQTVNLTCGVYSSYVLYPCWLGININAGPVYTVPSGQSLVITSIIHTPPQPAPSGPVQLFVGYGGPSAIGTSTGITLTASPSISTQFSLSSGIVVPAGQAPAVFVSGGDSFASIYLAGYVTSN